MTLLELKSGLVALLKTKYPKEKYRYYGIEVVEGYQRPSFFTQLKPVTMESANYNSNHNQFVFYIDYFQKTCDEADILRKIDEIRELFGLSVSIGDRFVSTTGFDYDFIGDDKNILEVSVDLEYFGVIEHEHTESVMDSVATKIEMED